MGTYPAMAETEKDLENLAVLDRGQIDLIIGDGDDDGIALLGELVNLFVEENQPHLGFISRASREVNMEELARHVHAMAGSSANLGGQRLALICRRIEALITVEKIPEATELVDLVEPEWNSLIDAFREITAN